MSEYDNTDSGAAFAPKYSKMILEGPINDNGTDGRIAVVQSSTEDGTVIRDIYMKIGTLFPNEAADESSDKFNPKAPKYTGPFGNRRCSVWTAMTKNNAPYMSFKIQDKFNGDAPAAAAQAANTNTTTPAELDDAIPF